MSENTSAIDAANSSVFSITSIVNTYDNRTTPMGQYVYEVNVTDNNGDTLSIANLTSVMNLTGDNWIIPATELNTYIIYSITNILTNLTVKTYLCVKENIIKYSTTPRVGSSWLPLTVLGQQPHSNGKMLFFHNDGRTVCLNSQNSELFETQTPAFIPRSSTKVPDSLWSGTLAPPQYTSSPSLTPNPISTNLNNYRVNIDGSVLVLLNNGKTPSLTCNGNFTDNGRLIGGLLIYNFNFDSTLPSNHTITTMEKINFSIEDDVILSEKELTIILILNDRDPKTSRGTVTTILKSS